MQNMNIHQKKNYFFNHTITILSFLHRGESAALGWRMPWANRFYFFFFFLKYKRKNLEFFT